MTAAPIYADAEGAAAAWANGDPALTGPGNPLAAGLHMSEVRSPATGAIGYVEVVSRTADDASDTPRTSFVIVSKTRGVAEIAARALADALSRLTTSKPVVATARGDRVRLYGADSIEGPTYAGDYGGEHAYRVDATLVLQPA